ncbi:hypothetical protein CVP05_01505 [Conservatibacter flavescens]|uniref:Uncharacterized protein n=1 Tax=Conservatibacter flavescens TaxID=28161 RepID=A0A2M8S5W7_9PAST|nr:hypothetical protein CVP05_01505 [Conservatibacter flavescens]
MIGKTTKQQQVNPALIASYDVIISIGKTVQYALLGHKPVYCYDHFGGCGYLNADNFDKAKWHNFSGRGFDKKTAEQIASELVDGFKSALQFAQDFSDMSAFRLDEFIKTLLNNTKPIDFTQKVIETVKLSYPPEEFLGELFVNHRYACRLLGQARQGDQQLQSQVQRLQHPAPKRPKILLAMPSDVGLYQCFQENLRFHGFDVVSVIAHIAKREISANHFILQLLKGETPAAPEYYDYALFIRSDIFVGVGLIDKIKPYVKGNMVAYQWDALARFPNIWKAVPFFERFFVYDTKDYQQHSDKFLPTSNFYFDHLPSRAAAPAADFYFVGAHVPGRQVAINRFAQLARQHGWTLQMEICAPSEQHIAPLRHYYPHDNICIQGRFKSFADNLLGAQSSKILVDFKTPNQEGLSFRAFEALGYRKKLVTTNENIKRYDFYHPNNIFVWDGVDLSGLAEFVQLPFVDIDPAIRGKYSFGNWIRYVLDLPPYQPIDLPI